MKSYKCKKCADKEFVITQAGYPVPCPKCQRPDYLAAIKFAICKKF